MILSTQKKLYKEIVKWKSPKSMIHFRMSFFFHQAIPIVTMITKTNRGTTMATTRLEPPSSLVDIVKLLFCIVWYLPWMLVVVDSALWCEILWSQYQALVLCLNIFHIPFLMLKHVLHRSWRKWSLTTYCLKLGKHPGSKTYNMTLTKWTKFNWLYCPIETKN